MEAVYKPKHRPGVTYIMCHMIADTDEELHTMAQQIGVARRWFQGDHYDITKSKRALAVKLGAVEIDRRTLASMAMLKRWGLDMGEPSTAQERLTAARMKQRIRASEIYEDPRKRVLRTSPPSAPR
jgi:hypothetical protein